MQWNRAVIMHNEVRHLGIGQTAVAGKTNLPVPYLCLAQEKKETRQDEHAHPVD